MIILIFAITIFILIATRKNKPNTHEIMRQPRDWMSRWK